MSSPLSTVVHGSAVAFGGRGLLILGTSGSGKSGLALALMGRGGQLVADDRVVLARREDVLVASAPAVLAGLIEARGVGILRVPAIPEAPLALVVDLDRPAAARMPQAVAITLLGLKLELISGKDLPNLDLVLSMVVQNGHTLSR